MGGSLGSLKSSSIGNRGIDHLQQDDVAVGRRELGHTLPKQSQLQDENALIKPSLSLTHWAIKFGSHYYQLVRTKDNKIEIVMINQLREKKSFNWEKKGTFTEKGSKIIELIQEINERKLSYDLLFKNCQHFAAAIGNYAMGLWDKQQALKYFAS